jgi:NRAMP (natural resistance-associated macrophage protein)-like metal ion transporter
MGLQGLPTFRKKYAQRRDYSRFQFWHDGKDAPAQRGKTPSKNMKGSGGRATPQKSPGLLRRFFSVLGPGLITGAADDDPSGIATYSITGAQLGTSLLWTAFLTWPLMGCIQFMCARIGMVTGRGLGGALRQKSPRWLLCPAAIALLIANTINVGADLAGMADAAAIWTGIHSHFFVLVFGVAIGWATVRCRYYQIVYILKWLAAVLFAYVITAFIIGIDWRTVVYDTFIPRWPHNHNAWQNLVAILGTTISPYLFFWQASQEVEEEKAVGRTRLEQRRGATPQEITDRKLDVGVGTFFSNFVMYFIILTTAMTLHTHGAKEITTSRDAAEALKPLAGVFAAGLYCIGLIGVGFLAIPTLTGSAAYALAEIRKWRHGLNETFNSARYFYWIVIGSTFVGILIDFANINPVKALFWTAVINGILAPFLLVGVLLVACDRKLMQNQPSSWLSRIVVGIATLVMFGAAIGMFVF